MFRDFSNPTEGIFHTAGSLEVSDVQTQMGVGARIKMTINIKLMPFSVPNFVHEETSRAVSQQNNCYPLSEVSSDELSDMCDDFRNQVFRKAQRPDPAR